MFLVDRFQLEKCMEAIRDMRLRQANRVQAPTMDIYNHQVLLLDRIKTKK